MQTFLWQFSENLYFICSWLWQQSVLCSVLWLLHRPKTQLSSLNISERIADCKMIIKKVSSSSILPALLRRDKPTNYFTFSWILVLKISVFHCNLKVRFAINAIVCLTSSMDHNTITKPESQLVLWFLAI